MKELLLENTEDIPRMHLSIHSDCFLSDSLAEPGFRQLPVAQHHAYRAGLLRGLALVAVAAVLIGLTFLGQLAQPAEAGPASRPGKHVAGGAHSTGSAVNAMHREVTRL